MKYHLSKDCCETLLFVILLGFPHFKACMDYIHNNDQSSKPTSMHKQRNHRVCVAGTQRAGLTSSKIQFNRKQMFILGQLKQVFNPMFCLHHIFGLIFICKVNKQGELFLSAKMTGRKMCQSFYLN